MHITTRNVNTAFRTLVQQFANGSESGDHSEWCKVIKRPSRNGNVLMIDEPVLITYTHPNERVLFNAARDANPFFGLYEQLWMLAGQNDVAPLAYYASKMKDYSDDGETLNGAYGYRWRHAGVTDKRGKTELDFKWSEVDQLDIIAAHLKADPHSRRPVLQMWNVEDDLLKIGKVQECGNCPSKEVAQNSGERPGGWPTFKHGQYIECKAGVPYVMNCPKCGGTGYEPASKDVACNLSVMFSVREEQWRNAETEHHMAMPVRGTRQVLDVTVTNRSNDMVWGMLGQDFITFSILQEYMAARIGCEVGRYHHFTNNLHVYDWNWKPEEWLNAYDQEMFNPYQRVDRIEGVHVPYNQIRKMIPLVKDPVVFEKELPLFAGAFNGDEEPWTCVGKWQEPFFQDVAGPLLTVFRRHKQKDREGELYWADKIQADDWRIAATNWLKRRIKK